MAEFLETVARVFASSTNLGPRVFCFARPAPSDRVARQARPPLLRSCSFCLLFSFVSFWPSLFGRFDPIPSTLRAAGFGRRRRRVQRQHRPCLLFLAETGVGVGVWGWG